MKDSYYRHIDSLFYLFVVKNYRILSSFNNYIYINYIKLLRYHLVNKSKNNFFVKYLRT